MEMKVKAMGLKGDFTGGRGCEGIRMGLKGKLRSSGGCIWWAIIGDNWRCFAFQFHWFCWGWWPALS